MATISFLVKGAVTGHTNPMAWVTIEEMDGGSLFFKVKQAGGIMGNLHGLYFDITDETLMNTLKLTVISNDIRVDEDSINGLRNGTNISESFNGKTKQATGGKDITREYAFTLHSRERALVLSDFSFIQLDYSDNHSDRQAVKSNDDNSHRWLYMALL